MDVLKRFVRYVTIDTQSDPHSSTTPSTMKQFDLANLLVKDLKELGIENVHLDEHCIVYARLASNVDTPVDRIGFIAHMDTASDMSGKGVSPKLVRNYNGGIITLNKELNITLDPAQFPCLLKDIGHDLVVTDGTTLLGADDKAGVSEIMTMLEYFVTHPEVKHGDIAVAFTPDEEVGRGTEHFDIHYFDVDYAYTVDGGDVDDIEYENFNASSAEVTIQGLSIHTGSAKGKMVNSLHLAMEFDAMLPKLEDPAGTDGYEGFHHLDEMNGDVEKTVMHYLLRDHDKELLKEKETLFYAAQDFLRQKYPNAKIEVNITPSYSNMREYIETRMDIVTRVKDKMKELHLTPKSSAIRGGTDGAMLTYKGLLCPNLGTGGRNFHGKYEYASIQEMRLACELLIKIATLDEE